jgi:O-antigen/teichoic acid export membrane protein
VSLSSRVAAHCPAFLRPSYDRIQASPLGPRLARGVFWSVAGTVMSRGLMLGAAMLVARMLGKSVYGELGMIQTTVGMFGVLAGFGLGLTATKYVAEFRKTDPERAGRILSLSALVALVSGSLMSLALLVLAPWLAERTIHAPHLAGELRIGALILLFSALNGAQTGALSGFEAFKSIALVNLVVGVFSFPILVAGAALGGITGTLWALCGNLALNWLLNHLALRKEAARWGVPLRLVKCRQEWSVLWRFSLPAVLAGSMVGPVDWACGAMLVNRPNGFGEMGIYSAANQWVTILLYLPGMLGSVLLPVLSDQVGQQRTAHSLKTLGLAIKVNLLLVMLPAAAASIASPWIMGLYGPTFANGWPTLIVVVFTAGLLAADAPIGHLLAASGRMWIGFVMNAGWGLAFLIGSALLIDHGSFGLALARALAYSLHTLWVLGFAVWFFKKNALT